MGENQRSKVALVSRGEITGLIARIQKDNPSFQLLFCQSPGELRDLVEKGKLDCVFVLTPVDPPLITALESTRPDMTCAIVALLTEPEPDIGTWNNLADRIIVLNPESQIEAAALVPLLCSWGRRSEDVANTRLRGLQTGFRTQRQGPEKNMDAITRLVGELLEADHVLYHRLDEGKIRTISSWQASDEMLPGEGMDPDACFCGDIIQKGNHSLVEVHNGGQSAYLFPDSDESGPKLQAAIGRAVWAGGKPVGCLYCAYKSPVSFSETDRIVMETAALLIGSEETRLIARNRLSASEQKYQELFDSVPTGIYRSLPDGTLLEANMELVRMLGYPDRETLLGRNVRELFQDPRDRDTWYAGVVNKRQHHDATYVLKRYDGSWVWVEDNGHAVLQEDGEVAYFEGGITDITRRIELEEAFRQAQKMDALGRLAGGFAHEFNNLLTVINGYAELLQSGTPPQHPSHERLGSILNAGRRAAELVSELLAFSRKQLIQPAPMHLGDHLNAMRDVMERLAGPMIAVTLRIDPELPCIKADSDQIEQLVLNLMLNAVAAIRDRSASETGSITLSAVPVTLEETLSSGNAEIEPGDYVRFTVEDDGIGIPEDIMPLIFEPFFTTREVGKGSGLGLAAVHGIAVQNGGLITVDSRPGEGSAFHILWPALTTPL